MRQKKNIFLKIKGFQYIVQKNNENKKISKILPIILAEGLGQDFGRYLEKFFRNNF